MFLAYMRDINKSSVGVGDVPVVWEFPNIFPEELASLPPKREVEFCIELILGTSSIAKVSYRMAPKEL